MHSFDNTFDEHCIRPPSFDVPELTTLTLGIFRRGLPNEIRSSDNLSFRVILQSYLNPYFTTRSRCIGIGDFFRYGDARFKVLGANPSYGVVSDKTLIQCSTLLDENPMLRFQILPVGDLRFTLESFQNGIQPYFRSMPRHIHEGQFLYLNNTECVVVASQPDNGVVMNQTEVYFEGDPLYRINTVTLVPYVEDLPMQLQRLSNSERAAELNRLYIMPYFKGQRRIVSPGRDIVIDRITFAVVSVEPGRGIVQDNTHINYEGTMVHRAVQVQLDPNLILARHPGALRDPRIMLIRQILQLQEMLQAMGHPQSSGAPQDVIDTLPTHRIQSIPDNPELSKCMICLCDYEIGEEVRTLPCFHIFHVQCIDEWLSRNKLCPICKTPCDVLPM